MRRLVALGDRVVWGRMVVNPGSVGMPYGRGGAHWALLGPGVELRRTALDVDAVCASVVAESGFPDVANWVRDAIRLPASDVAALAAFGVS